MRKSVLAMSLILPALFFFFPTQSFSEELSSDESTKCAVGYAFAESNGECLACNKPCATGLAGICARGLVECAGEIATCKASVKPNERFETCNGEDDNCDGRVDEGFDKDGDKYTTCSGDCDDRNPNIYPDAVEKCDLVDNNCNGLVDDGFNIGKSCFSGVGECAVAGTRVCSKTGDAAMCDAISGRASTEICDGKDNDCDGVTDEGLGEISCGVGACRVSVQACQGGKLIECSAAAAGRELCGNGVDDDCDGLVDEGFEKNGTTCFAGVGGCKTEGRFACSADKLSLECSAKSGTPVAEICGNKIDDDCDGAIDTDTDGLGTGCDNKLLGECNTNGVMLCDGGKLSCSAAKPSPKNEICDGKDNDCNGEVDNGVTNECGGCGKLNFKLGTACKLTGGDDCATGKWSCSDKSKDELICEPAFEVSENKDCPSDANPCTNDICKKGKCAHVAVTDGASCDDGDSCTQEDFCVAGDCRGAGQMSCDDENLCTKDSCDPIHGCYNVAVGAGVKNVCGGCEELKHEPKEKCDLKNLKGACKSGEYMCAPDGGLSCVQNIFAQKEICNGIDDDCNGEVDEGFGQTTCGVGSCQVTVDNCSDGKLQPCLSGAPITETCRNMNSDNDCNGKADDIAEIHSSCRVAIGTCMLPGTKKCIGDADFPLCAISNPDDAEDDDGDGIPNYCDEGHAGSNDGIEAPRSKFIFDAAKTRAVAFPWFSAIASTVVSPSNPEHALLIVSGKSGQFGGLAATRLKDIASAKSIEFQSCESPAEFMPDKIITVGEIADVIALSPSGYVVFPKVVSQIPSISTSATNTCKLRAQTILNSQMRKVLVDGKEVTCTVSKYFDIASFQDASDSFAGLLSCSVPSGSMWKKDQTLLLADLFSRNKTGGFDHSPILLSRHSNTIDSGLLYVSSSNRELRIIAGLKIDGNFSATTCRKQTDAWQCVAVQSKDEIEDVSFTGISDPSARSSNALFIAKRGQVFSVFTDWKNKTANIEKTQVALKEGEQINSARWLMENFDSSPVMAIAMNDAVIPARLISRGKGVELILLAQQKILPDSKFDNFKPDGGAKNVSPHALATLPLKKFGGGDLFVAFDSIKENKKIGESGFYFWNFNEAPLAEIGAARFDGKRGSVKISFTDPTNDALKVSAEIKAAHGGLLSNWVDGYKNGELQFSAKAEAAAVGIWPIKIFVTATDEGGLATTATVALTRDGKVESVSQTSK